VTVFRVSGLDGPVEILRDRLGIPHCYAASEHDAFFAQGFVHAADRLWQMDYDRRRGLGRWAQVAGSGAVAGDMFFRRLGLRSHVQRDLGALGRAARDMLAAYAAGVNAAIGRLPLPREFGLTQAVPEPWEPWHSLLVHRVRHVTMGSARSKLWRAIVAEVLGQAAVARLTGAGDEQVACLPPGTRIRLGLLAALGGADDASAAGSNNWVVAGSRTASGLPLLAGDSHRPLEVPNVYAQGHLACPEWDVLGAAMPGVPGFPHFGHNAHLAWSITHAMADDQDLYRHDQVRPVRPGGHASGRPAVTERVEVIEVAGGGPVRVRVGSSDRGALIADGLALAWTATAEPNRGFDALPAMLRARSVSELFEAMRPWNEPVNNLLAADKDGTIGYLTRGRIPVRARPEAALLPVPGEDLSYGWRGWVAFEDLPRAIDPENGFFLSANNRILAADDGPGVPYIGMDVAAPWRASRITAVLSGLTDATVADMAALHRDVTSEPARDVARRLAGWQPLAGWDGAMAADSSCAAAYSVLRRELALLLLERSGLAAHLGHPWNRLLPGVRPESVMWQAAYAQMRRDEAGMLGGWSWERALREAVARAERAWNGESWGTLHATAQRHPLGRPELDPPSVPYGGDMDTVQASPYVPVEGLATVAGSVVRYAFDVADWDRSGWIVPLGAGGEPGSAHFSDQQECWRSGQLAPAPYSRAAVEASATGRDLVAPG
jgi:penicillin amidase